jgi:predicted DNA binding CopG/RHH family protein
MLKKEIQMTTKLNSKQVKDTEEAWDSRALGADEQYVVVADDAHEAALEEALELQAISIRLPKDLIRNYKLIADFHGVGYQPLMRDILHRFVKPALKEILEEQIKAEKAKPERPPLVPLKMAA